MRHSGIGYTDVSVARTLSEVYNLGIPGQHFRFLRVVYGTLYATRRRVLRWTCPLRKR